jgi:hypothetical protein
VVLNNYGLPMRTNQPTCEYFMRKGSCRFGLKCHKHHPHLQPGPPITKKPAPATTTVAQGPVRRQQQQSPAANSRRRMEGQEFVVVDNQDGFYPQFPRNPGQEACPHFMRTGDCKFAASCSFDHPPDGLVLRNRDNLPLRPGEQVCRFYLLNGECGYGPACMKHHPNIMPKPGALGMQGAAPQDFMQAAPIGKAMPAMGMVSMPAGGMMPGPGMAPEWRSSVMLMPPGGIMPAAPGTAVPYNPFQ